MLDVWQPLEETELRLSDVMCELHCFITIEAAVVWAFYFVLCNARLAITVRVNLINKQTNKQTTGHNARTHNMTHC
jgi:hypothetical protein